MLPCGDWPMSTTTSSRSYESEGGVEVSSGSSALAFVIQDSTISTTAEAPYEAVIRRTLLAKSSLAPVSLSLSGLKRMIPWSVAAIMIGARQSLVFMVKWA